MPSPSPAPTARSRPGTVPACRLVELPEHRDHRGALTVVESGKEIDFDVRRAYLIHDVPVGVDRGAHGHRRLRQLIIAVHGSFDVIADDGRATQRFRLDRPGLGLLVAPMVWRDMVDFAPGTVGLWLVSEPYDEAEYHRGYAEFLADAGRDAGAAS